MSHLQVAKMLISEIFSGPNYAEKVASAFRQFSAAKNRVSAPRDPTRALLATGVVSKARSEIDFLEDEGHLTVFHARTS